MLNAEKLAKRLLVQGCLLTAVLMSACDQPQPPRPLIKTPSSRVSSEQQRQGTPKIDCRATDKNVDANCSAL